MKCARPLVFLIIMMSCFWNPIGAQNIPSDRILDVKELSQFLKKDVRSELAESRKISDDQLATYFREKFSERFFYDYRTVNERFALYNKLYSNQSHHQNRAMDHMGKYADSTQWVLPFNYLNGEAVNAYALRHLARQHKMVDIALHYFNNGRDPKYIRYFENQQRSLNRAFDLGQYEKIEDGNGVYEVFRSGYRILNWLWIHNLFLNEEEYSNTDQLQTIATLLQHAAHLYEHNDKFRPGNHQTRGMSALALVAILLRDFEDTDLWLERAMLRLSEHLDKEINDDGFQFERSVHYHMSDIKNYFYVYQLATISQLEVDDEWTDKLRTLFTTLVKIAYPDKSAPVLQDDTEIPWGETNDIAGVMTLGYLLFKDPEYGYFARNRVNAGVYWFLQQSQLDLLEDIRTKKPTYGSLSFPNTHYYIMREGWEPNDKVMVISAGLDDQKPDHQHGDMLGIQAMANGHPILPNYQVRYSLTDFDLFKNSMVKNVALVDEELQGKEWTSNKGGSGFGKFRNLPNPKVITWKSNKDFDLFVGSHDGFENVGVRHQRQVIYIKDDFWILKDNFQSDAEHEYKQIFQGHYTHEEGPDLIRASFPEASGCDIVQLKSIDKVSGSGARGKNWTVLSKTGESTFSFITALYPYRGYNNRIDESIKDLHLGEWQVNNSEWTYNANKATVLTKTHEAYFFDVQKLDREGLNIQTSKPTDLYIKLDGKELSVHLLGTTNADLMVTYGEDTNILIAKKEMKPGDQLEIHIPK
ncbi:MAG: heparinase II/III family protein [Bacteroidia bacterium]|nr:heparinase II/III family protein [Bacteroidia bacterium]